MHPCIRGGRQMSDSQSPRTPNLHTPNVWGYKICVRKWSMNFKYVLPTLFIPLARYWAARTRFKGRGAKPWTFGKHAFDFRAAQIPQIEYVFVLEFRVTRFGLRGVADRSRPMDLNTCSVGRLALRILDRNLWCCMTKTNN